MLPGIFVKDVLDHDDAKAVLRERNILTQQLEAFFENKDDTGNAAEITYLAANLYSYLISLSD